MKLSKREQMQVKLRSERAAYMRNYYSTHPEYKAKMRAYQQSPEYKAKMRAYYKDVLSKSPEYKAKKRAYQQSPEYKAKHGQRQCANCNSWGTLRKAFVNGQSVFLCTPCIEDRPPSPVLLGFSRSYA